MGDVSGHGLPAALLMASLRAGLRWRDWELAASYELNTFATARFLPTGDEVDYDWSHLTLRLAFALPRI